MIRALLVASLDRGGPVIRLVPPPRVGRWLVWKVSHYPAGGLWLVGRYRCRWTARLIAWSLNRQRWTAMHHFEARPRRTPPPS